MTFPEARLTGTLPAPRPAASLSPARQSVLAGQAGCRRRWLVGATIATTEPAAPNNANSYAEAADTAAIRIPRSVAGGYCRKSVDEASFVQEAGEGQCRPGQCSLAGTDPGWYPPLCDSGTDGGLPGGSFVLTSQ